MGWRDWLHLLMGAIHAVVCTPSTTQKFHSRIRACYRCPIFDRELKRCRPYTGSPNGCGCFVVWTAKSLKTCWLQDRNPKWGWGSDPEDFLNRLSQTTDEPRSPEPAPK